MSLFKINIYTVTVTEYPGASWRGKDKKQVYTGKVNRHGKKDYESRGDIWFETKAEAIEALRVHFQRQVEHLKKRLVEAKANLEKAF